MRATQIKNLIVLGEGSVSVDRLGIAFGVCGVLVLQSRLEDYRIADRAQTIYVAMDRLHKGPGDPFDRIDDLVAHPNTFAIVKAEEVQNPGLLAKLKDHGRVLVVEADEGALSYGPARAGGKQPYFDSSTLRQVVQAVVSPGGQVYLHDFDYEFTEMQRRGPIEVTLLVHRLRSADIYVSSNVPPRDSELRSVYVEDPVARFFWAPEVSIVMPTYDGTAFIEEALKSITQQEDVDYEVIVIDDGSTDETAKLVEAYAARDDRVLLTCQRNRGPQATRNRGIAMAKGNYVTFLDHDDFLLPGSLQRRLEILREGEHLICGGRCRIVDLEGKDIGLTVGRRTDTYYRDCHQMPIFLGTLTGRSDVMKRHQFPLISGYADDWTYVNHMLREGWSIGNCGADALVGYRWHRTSWTGSDIDKHFFNCMHLLRDLSIRPAHDLGIVKKPEGSMELAEKHIERSRFVRIQAEFFSLALRDDEGKGDDSILETVIGMMNGISGQEIEPMELSTFDSTASKVFIAHPDDPRFMKEVMNAWYTAVSLCDRLAKTPANALYVQSLTKYLTVLRQRMASRNEPVPPAGLLERLCAMALERFEDVALDRAKA